MQRREFIKWSLAQAVVTTFPLRAPTAPMALRRSEPSVLQGATDASRTQFSVVYWRDVNLDFAIQGPDSLEVSPDRVERFTHGGHDKAVTKVYVSGLRPNTAYILELKDSSTKETLDRREFATWDPASEPRFRFAVGSCMDDARHESDIWRDLVSQRPHALFFIGDSVYADRGGAKPGTSDPAQLWRRFCEARATLDIYFSKRLIPIFATWDDHDFGANDSDGSFRFAAEARDNFLTFFAQDPSHCDYLERGPGVSSALTAGDHLVILADDRTFRAPSGSTERFGHWGEDQENWIVERIQAHRGPVWLMNGSQFFPSVPWKQSVSRDHEPNLEGLVARLRGCSNRVVFISGDVHYSEISEIESEALGYRTYEITSSSIHSRGIPGAPSVVPNRRRIESTGRRNYVLIEAGARGQNATFHVASRSAGDHVNFERELSV